MFISNLLSECSQILNKICKSVVNNVVYKRLLSKSDSPCSNEGHIIVRNKVRSVLKIVVSHKQDVPNMLHCCFTTRSVLKKSTARVSMKQIAAHRLETIHAEGIYPSGLLTLTFTQKVLRNTPVCCPTWYRHLITQNKLSFDITRVSLSLRPIVRPHFLAFWNYRIAKHPRPAMTCGKVYGLICTPKMQHSQPRTVFTCRSFNVASYLWTNDFSAKDDVSRRGQAQSSNETQIITHVQWRSL